MPSQWPKDKLPNANLLRQPKVRWPGPRSALDFLEIEELDREEAAAREHLATETAARQAPPPYWLSLTSVTSVASVESRGGAATILPHQRAFNSADSVASVETRGGGVPLHSTSTFNPAAPAFQPTTPIRHATAQQIATRSARSSSDGASESAATITSSIVPASSKVTVNTPASNTENTHMALVVQNKPKSGLLFDCMGTEIVRIEVAGRDGQQPQTFSVHRNLLISIGGRLEVEFAKGRGDVRELHNVSTIAFKILIEYAYKRILIKTDPKLHINDNRLRLTGLCHFYGFAEAYKLDHRLINEVMDGIQDGFVALNSLPPASFCKLMYAHTQSGSPFRKFLAAGVLARHRHPKLLRDENLPALLKSNDEFLRDFLEAVKSMEPGAIPTVREITAEMERDGYAGPPMVVVPEGVRGLHPCHFHVHTPIETPEIQVGESAGENASANSLHEACHFFPEG